MRRINPPRQCKRVSDNQVEDATNNVSEVKTKRRKNVPMAVREAFKCPRCQIAGDKNGHDMVACNKCFMEYHQNCVGYTNEMDKNGDEWHCNICLLGMLNNDNDIEPMADPNQLLHRTLQFAVSNYAIADGVDGVNGVNIESDGVNELNDNGVQRKSKRRKSGLCDVNQRRKARKQKRLSREKIKLLSPKEEEKEFKKYSKLPNFAKKVTEENWFHHIKEFDVGDMDYLCDKCGAKFFKGERKVGGKKDRFGVYHDCCNFGKKIIEDPFSDFPEELKQMFKSKSNGIGVDGEFDWQNFHENIRQFNSMFAVGSMKAEADPKLQKSWPYVYKIHGQVYNCINTAKNPDPGDMPSYAQLYYIDTEEALNCRMSLESNQKCDIDLAQQIDLLLRNVNPYFLSYQSMHEIEEAEYYKAQEEGRKPPVVQLYFDLDANVDKRRFNIPSENTVAAVVVLNENDEFPPHQGIVIKPRGKELQSLTKWHRQTESMVYPLLFPTAKGGWYPENHQTNSKGLLSLSGQKLTCLDYYKYLLAIRDEVCFHEKSGVNCDCIDERIKFNPIHYAGKLFQQYTVDAYVKVEQDRLDFVRKAESQKTFKAESYKGLTDYLEETADEMGVKIGRTIILPSSFTGSPRHCQQGYQDSMAMVRKFGKPEYFITMTCNTEWREIRENLYPGQSVEERADIVDRVFKLKLNELIDDLTVKHVLGKCIAYTYVVEFQKRGLPHAHILIIVDPKDKIKSPAELDKVIWAQLPTKSNQAYGGSDDGVDEAGDLAISGTAEVKDNETYEKLKKIVGQKMIHGPCKGKPCMDGVPRSASQCGKKFPKEYMENTTMTEDAFAKYERPNNNESVVKQGVEYDNRYVVPYAPYFMLKYNAHINVEFCASVKSVKYIYKYVYKGHDCARMIKKINGVEQLDHDEVSRYLELRYIAPHEAFWRLMSYDIEKKKHHIERLEVHLPNEQLLYYRPSENIRDVVQNAKNRESKLTAWFKLNQVDPDANELFYYEVPEKYTWHPAVQGVGGSWKRRMGGKPTLGRMYTVSHKTGDLFYLRMLLINLKGAKSWEDLLRDPEDPNLIHPSFKESCDAHGFSDNGDEWIKYLNEMALLKMPLEFRNLFVTILFYNEPGCAAELWEKYKLEMSEDYLDKLKKVKPMADITELTELAIEKAKSYIELKLRELGVSLSKYKISLPTDLSMLSDQQKTPQEEYAKYRKMYKKCGSIQKKIINSVIELIKLQRDGKVVKNGVFIDGPAGTGKTYTYQTLCHYFRGNDIKFMTMSWMGIAAILLPEGITVHKGMGLPVPLYKDSNSNISIKSHMGQKLSETEVFIIDEAPMLPKYVLKIFDKKLREITGVDSPFGGKVLVMGGDFRQTLPIKRFANRSELLSLSIKYSEYWSFFEVFKLVKNRRVYSNVSQFAEPASQEDLKDFADYLLKLGEGLLEVVDGGDRIELPERCLVRDGVAPMADEDESISEDSDDEYIREALKQDSLIESVFGEALRGNKLQELLNRVILTTTNEKALLLNIKIMKLFSGLFRVYNSVDKVDEDQPKSFIEYPPEFLHTLDCGGLPSHELMLKEGVPIMLLRNLNPAAGLCNGTRLTLVKMHDHLLECDILTGDKKGNRVFIHRIPCTTEESRFPFILTRRQFPVKPCFAMTINKSQGQTLDFVGLDLEEEVFSHGQLYVAFSRVRSWNCIKVRVNKDYDNCTRNVVWKEALL